MKTEFNIFVIQNEKGQFYNPSSRWNGGFWKDSLGKAKLFKRIGDAKNAITLRRGYYRNKTEFENVKIVPCGLMTLDIKLEQ